MVRGLNSHPARDLQGCSSCSSATVTMPHTTSDLSPPAQLGHMCPTLPHLLISTALHSLSLRLDHTTFVYHAWFTSLRISVRLLHVATNDRILFIFIALLYKDHVFLYVCLLTDLPLLGFCEQCYNRHGHEHLWYNNAIFFSYIPACCLF